MYIATATAPGSAHVNPGREGKRNNQDVIVRREHARGSVVVLCDGCGSQPYSGTGADIGANVIARVICDRLSTKQFSWATITDDVVAALRGSVAAFAADSSVPAFEAAVQERFLFTAMVVVTIDHVVVVGAFGDGVVMIDDEVIELKAPIPEAPPYIGYLLIAEGAYRTSKLKQHLAFKIVKTLDTRKLQRGLIVGTDGFKDLVREDMSHPALAETQLLQGWLNAQTVERMRDGALVGGRCSDDVSLVLIRSEETQQRLLEGRRETVALKQEIAQLKESVSETKMKLMQATGQKDIAERRAEGLERQLKWVRDDAARVHRLEREVEVLRERLRELREEKEAERQSKDAPAGEGSFIKSVFGLMRSKSKPDEDEKGPKPPIGLV